MVIAAHAQLAGDQRVPQCGGETEPGGLAQRVDVGLGKRLGRHQQLQRTDGQVQAITQQRADDGHAVQGRVQIELGVKTGAQQPACRAVIGVTLAQVGDQRVGQLDVWHHLGSCGRQRQYQLVDVWRGRVLVGPVHIGGHQGKLLFGFARFFSALGAGRAAEVERVARHGERASDAHAVPGRAALDNGVEIEPNVGAGHAQRQRAGQREAAVGLAVKQGQVFKGQRADRPGQVDALVVVLLQRGQQLPHLDAVTLAGGTHQHPTLTAVVRGAGAQPKAVAQAQLQVSVHGGWAGPLEAEVHSFQMQKIASRWRGPGPHHRRRKGPAFAAQAIAHAQGLDVEVGQNAGFDLECFGQGLQAQHLSGCGPDVSRDRPARVDAANVQ